MSSPLALAARPRRSSPAGELSPSPREIAGSGSIIVARIGARSALLSARAHSPLRFIQPKNHGHAAWLFTTSFGGGLVDGDHLSLDVHVEHEAALLLATPAATKVYRSPHGCRQSLRAHVDPGGLLLSLPEPVVCFAGARYRQDTHVALADGASLLVLDALGAGRAAYGERWAFASVSSSITITRPAQSAPLLHDAITRPAQSAPLLHDAITRPAQSAPLLHDALVLDPRHGEVAARMRHFDALATLVAVGPRVARVCDDAFALARRPLQRDAPVLLAASPVQGGVLVRFAASSQQALSRVTRQLLAPLPDLLGDDPFRAG